MGHLDDLAAWRHDLRRATAMLTRLPAGRGAAPHEGAPARAVRAFPLVGAMVGLGGALALWLGDGLGLPGTLAALGAVGATILMTGALHEDGLADLTDGFGGSFERARKLAIMRASDIGTYGTLALMGSVAARVGALAALASHGLWIAAAALVAAHALARAMMPPVMALLPLARDDGLAAGVGRATRAHAAVALGLGALIGFAALGLATGAVALLAAGAATALMARLARAQIGGYTGDVLGACEQTAEVAVLLAATALS
ncbi:MAG: adenosylcobinamide-GDP ribazoletransferase [Kiloniellaceae bacterium]